jgi:hypothetical protein
VNVLFKAEVTCNAEWHPVGFESCRSNPGGPNKFDLVLFDVTNIFLDLMNHLPKGWGCFLDMLLCPECLQKYVTETKPAARSPIKGEHKWQ